MGTYHRFELAFDGEPQEVGFLIGLRDVGLPSELEEHLRQPFEMLKSPCLLTETVKPVKFWFTDFGVKSFGEAVCAIGEAIADYNWSLLYFTKDDDINTAIYSDEHQAAWISKDAVDSDALYQELPF